MDFFGSLTVFEKAGVLNMGVGSGGQGVRGPSLPGFSYVV